MRLEPFNPFDTSDKECFPELEEALALEAEAPEPEEGDPAAVVDIDQLSRSHPVDIDTANPPDLGFLPWETSQLLEARCQAWFDTQSSLKGIRVGGAPPCAAVALLRIAPQAWGAVWQSLMSDSC